MSTHDTHSHDHSDHGSVRSYATGFILSVILTAVPFWLVMSGGTGDKVVTTLIVLGFAVVQILVHMVYFLHMTAKAEAGWTLLSTIFTVVVVVIMLAGSLWVMYHMNTNMMPQMQME